MRITVTIAGYNAQQRKEAARLREAQTRISGIIGKNKAALHKLRKDGAGKDDPRIKGLLNVRNQLNRSRKGLQERLTKLRKAAGYGQRKPGAAKRTVKKRGLLPPDMRQAVKQLNK